MPVLNFSSAPKREPLEIGDYDLVIKGYEKKTTSTGKDMYVIRFEEPEKKAVIFENFLLEPENLFRIAGLLEALGYTVDPEQDMEIDFGELVGQVVKAKVVQDTYEGVTRNKIKKFLKP